ncbi:MAG: hypothetical protein SFU87_11470 [Chitinophagaceae bacterium]|nr:hypothetical protein [Chitinophagaceae bacterium]
MKTSSDLRKQVKKYIDTADDKTVKMIHAMLEAEKEDDWWDDLPAEIKAEIDKALEELDKGKGIPHEQVVKRYRKWFTR